MKTVRVRVLRSHVIGVGAYAQVGDILDLPQHVATERIHNGSVEPAPPEVAPETPAAAEPAPAAQPAPAAPPDAAPETAAPTTAEAPAPADVPDAPAGTTSTASGRKASKEKT